MGMGRVPTRNPSAPFLYGSCILGGCAVRCFCRPARFFTLLPIFSGRAFWVGTLSAVFAGRRDFSLRCCFFRAVHSGWVRCPLFLPAGATFHFVAVFFRAGHSGWVRYSGPCGIFVLDFCLSGSQYGVLRLPLLVLLVLNFKGSFLLTL